MGSLLKPVVFHTAKALGLFALSRRLIRGKLRILCYHGFSLAGEEKFVPGMFITPEEFERRMNFLASAGYDVLPFDAAVERLKAGTLPADPVAITIDDGFYSVYKAAMPVLERHRFPATLYLTSYYFEKGSPIFNLVVDYMFWATAKTSADLSSLGVPGLGSGAAAFPDGPSKDRLAQAIIAYGDSLDGSDKRAALARSLGGLLDVPYETLEHNRILSLIDAKELAALRKAGIEIELHTHRHDLPTDADKAVDAIALNRRAVEPHLPAPMRHFCYPSGVWSRAHWPALAASGVETATTCDTGFVYPDTAPFAMPRILDSARVSQIEFEAELSGFLELKRRLLQLLRRNAGPAPAAAMASRSSEQMIG
jgi:peptidoglycan/xylan/chitin deacetylase (PgdA/CDA1 family)